MASSKKLKAVLVNLPLDALEDDRRQPPGGLVSMATYASKQGHDVSVCDLAGCPFDTLLDRIPDADIYGFSTYTVNYKHAVTIMKSLQSRAPRARFIAGGPHASALPQETAQDFQTVVCGEGEEAFLQLLGSLALDPSAPLPRIVRADPIEDLDALPVCEFERFCRMETYSRRIDGLPVMSLDSSRGCDQRCRFCNSRIVERGRWRGRSPESVAAEVLRHHNQGWRAFRFNDDNFLVDPQRAYRICALMSDIHVKFRIFARAESLCDADLCRQLFAAGCVHVAVGIESLSAAMLARMGKATCVDRIRLGVRTAHEAGLDVRGFFICGYPGETEDTVRESIDALDELLLDEAVVYPCIPYPGTDLFAQPDRYGIQWIDPDFSRYIQIGRDRSAGFVMRTRTFGPSDVQRWRERYMAALDHHGIAWADALRRTI